MECSFSTFGVSTPNSVGRIGDAGLGGCANEQIAKIHVRDGNNDEEDILAPESLHDERFVGERPFLDRRSGRKFAGGLVPLDRGYSVDPFGQESI